MPATPPPPDADDPKTVKRFLMIAAAAMGAGLVFLAVCVYFVVRDGG